MRNILAFSLASLFAATSPMASAQIVNPSFETGDFTGWSVAGIPVVTAAPPTAPAGTFQALINSTDSNAVISTYTTANAVSAATLNTFLGTALPGNGQGAAINGEAIKQTFTTTGKVRLTFSYKYDSRELGANGFDETGYVLNGTFHILADSLTPGQSFANGVGFLYSGLPYQTTTITLNGGVNTLGFVAYNTGNDVSPTGIFLDNFVFTPLLFSVPGLTPNQFAIASYIDAHDSNPTGNFANIVNALLAAPSTQALQAELDQLSPQSLGIFRNIAFDNSTFFSEDVNNHLAGLRDGLTGFDSSQLNVSDSSLSPGASRIHHHLGDPQVRDPKEVADTKEMATAPASSGQPNRWSAWLAGDVILADLNSTPDLSHQDYTTGSVMAGIDYRIDDHFTVGALVGYGHTDATLDHEGSKATADTYYPGLYASYVDGGWYGNGLVAYNYNSYTEDRHVALPGLSGFNQGATQGNEYLADLTGGHEFQTGSFKYGPFAGVQYAHVDIDSFTEDGPTSLHIDSQSDNSLRSQLGLEARYVTHVGDVGLVPHVSAAWQHEFLDDNHAITSQFNGAGPGSFTVQTPGTSGDSAFIDAGMDADVCRDVTLFTEYQTEAGAQDFFAQSVLAGVRVGF